MHFNIGRLFFIYIIFMSISFAQFTIRHKDNSVVIYGIASKPAEVSSLPSNIPVPDNCISLFADDRTKKQGYTIVYLINNSKDSVLLDSQDGGINIMLEAKDKDGKWERCQVYIHGWCGNSYYSLFLLPGMFTKINGLYPDSGFATKLRYGLYYGNYSPRIKSNEIDGFIRTEMFEEARYDPMIIKQGDFDYVKNVVLGKIKVPANKYKYGHYNAEYLAIDRLMEFNSDSSFVVLKQIINNKNTSAALREYTVYNLHRLKLYKTHDYLLHIINNYDEFADSDKIIINALLSLSNISKKEALQIEKNILISKSNQLKEIIWKIVCDELEMDRMYLNRKKTATTLTGKKDNLQSDSNIYLNDSALCEIFSDNRNDYLNPAFKYIMKGYCLFEPAGVDEYLISVKNNSAISDEIRKYAQELYRKRRMF